MLYPTTWRPGSHLRALGCHLSTILLLSGVLTASAQVGQADTNQWRLVWADEFDKPGLPDSNKWDYEDGFVRNAEPQYYTRARQENARVENGILIIEARKEQFKNARYDGKTPADDPAVTKRPFAEYTSAALVTWKKADWQYGRFEIRAKLPMANGLWPAFWTLGTDRSRIGWPGCGEIDIMECWGRTPRSVTSCVHYRQDGKHKSDFGKIESKESLEQFHVYAMEWSSDRMDFFYDGAKYHTVPLSKLEDNGQNGFRKPHYILLNLALEGRGKKIPDTSLPGRLEVDYVRIYQSNTGK